MKWRDLSSSDVFCCRTVVKQKSLGMLSKIPIKLFSIWEYFSLGREVAMIFEVLSSESSIKGRRDIMVLGKGAGTSNTSLNVSE